MRRPVRNLTLGALIIAAALGYLLYQGLSNNLVYYITPSELYAKGPGANGQNFRLGGQVRPGSVLWNATTRDLRFVLQDPKNHVAVESHGLPPEMFRAGAGVVVEGTFSHGTFSATNLMIKHGSTYRAPKPGQTPVPDNFVSSSG
ncbi:MAG TPA: cytochrome c maturation protein CcmE [Chloroflexota bacterium]